MDYLVGMITFTLLFGYYSVKYLYISLSDQYED